MAFAENISNSEIKNLRNKITLNKFCEIFKGDKLYSFASSNASIVDSQKNWNESFTYGGTPIIVYHQDGYMTLDYPVSPLIEENIKNGENIKNKIDLLLGIVPCCRFKTAQEESSQVYVFSDGLSSDECFQLFESLSENKSYKIQNLERLDSVPVDQLHSDISDLIVRNK